jgi:hypothetical protein
MADAVGLLDLPVTAPDVSPPQERDLSPGDPALVQLAAFAASVLQNDVADAWAVLSPGKPDQTGAIDGTIDGSGPVRRAFYSDPRKGYFEPSDLPAIFVYRAPQSTSSWQIADAQRLRSQVVIAWVAPPTEQDFQRRERDPFFHAVRASLHVALTQRRHAAWVLTDDQADTDALKTSFATSTSIATITSFNGALGSETLRTGRPVSVTTSAATGAYNTAAAITVTGTLDNGLEHTESIYLTEANGAETVETIFPFASVSSVAFPAMLTTTGSLTIGYDDRPDVGKGSLIQRACDFREMKFTRAQTTVIQVAQPDGERKAFEAIEFFIDVAEDSAIDMDLRAHDPWDIEAHGTRTLPADDEFAFTIQD